MRMKRLLLRPLTIPEILRWADAHREASGKWPTKDCGDIATARFESWSRVDAALRAGTRGLPGGSSLAQLLAEKRGARNIHDLPLLTVPQILEWADQRRERTGTWPNAGSGIIPGSNGEKWANIENALRAGSRGLPAGGSIAKLLAEHRGTRNRKDLPSLQESQLLEWADLHQQRTGARPTAKSGAIVDAPGETWLAADMALRHGRRSFPGGTSLAKLLAEKRNVRNAWTLPPLTIMEILRWADACHARTGNWPNLESGPILNVPGETWGAVNHALRRGSRGLSGGRTLAQLLAAERGVQNGVNRPRLSRKQILVWALAHHRRTGGWPTKQSGCIPEATGETWAAVDAALMRGGRGLRPGSSLAKLLAAHGKKQNHRDLPPLSQRRILMWADAHFQATGEWPNVNSGEIADAPGERWDVIDAALRQGHRRLAGGTSLHRLLVRKRNIRNSRALPLLSEGDILRWAGLHRQRTGASPTYKSGAIKDAPCETWACVDWALRYGKRGLPGGSSLAKLIAGAGTAASD